MDSVRSPSRCAVWLCVVFIVAGVGAGTLFFSVRKQIRGDVADFARRAGEAKGLVTQIYAFYDDREAWPQKLSDVTPFYREYAEKQWEYCWDGNDANGGPLLRLRGPYHTSLVYRFPPKRELKPDNHGWRCSEEGAPIRMDAGQDIPSGFFAGGKPE